MHPGHGSPVVGAGLKASDLMKSKSGKIVSKKQSMSAKKNFAKRLGGWNKAVMAARKALGVKGFCAVGGKSAQGALSIGIGAVRLPLRRMRTEKASHGS